MFHLQTPNIHTVIADLIASKLIVLSEKMPAVKPLMIIIIKQDVYTTRLSRPISKSAYHSSTTAIGNLSYCCMFRMNIHVINKLLVSVALFSCTQQR